MPEFDTLVADALGFFDDLAADNSRDWFAANKARYERAVKAPAEALLAEIAVQIATATGAAPETKLYRINRDLRFSKDKTPYNTHLHLQWSDPATGICHLFGVSRAYVCAGVGAMGFDKAALDRWRDRIAGTEGVGFARLLDRTLAAGHRMDPPDLKRVPAPWPQDHPQAELLKRKGLVLWHDLSDVEQAHPVAALDAAFARLGPFRAALAEVLSPG